MSAFHDLLRDQQPLLAQIDEAIARFRRGNPEPVRDPESNEAFEVWEDRQLGVMVVARGGKVVQRVRFTPEKGAD